MNRYIQTAVGQDLIKKMVFIGGPRQVGKTTLAKNLLEKSDTYLNWDENSARTRILDQQLPQKGLLVFDELHKYRKWRNYLKGIYDTKPQALKILVTGSARLDIYRFGGDSLQGRYFYWRLHPLSLAELVDADQSDLEQLFQLGGFPEPFLSGSQRNAKRWSREYRARLVREEIASLESISDLATLELLIGHLPVTIGNPLSINSLREQLQINHSTAAKWLEALERIYAFFRLSPFGAPKLRAVKKEQKAYMFDWSVIEDSGFKFENMVAVHLLKYVHFMQDSEGLEYELQYYRDTTPREVDFVITLNGKPLKAIECKLNDTQISPHLKYFKNRFPACECIQLHLQGQKDYVSGEGIRVMPARLFLKDLK